MASVPGSRGQNPQSGGPHVVAGVVSVSPAGLLPEERDGTGRKIYRCGTLSYTLPGLVMIFAWLLWGDFCFTLMEQVVPSIMPLKLHSLESSNWIIALIMSTLPGVFNTTVCPWVSFKSDRYRSRWGRRIPFIVYTMPFLVASLIFIGFSDQLGAWLHAMVLSHRGWTQSMAIVMLLAIFAGFFDLFNMFVGSVYWYLFNDVVPAQFLSRFLSLFRMVGILAGMIYSKWIFPESLDQ